MMRAVCRTIGVVVLAAGSVSVVLPAQGERPAAKAGEWLSYHGNTRGHHYSPLAQIDGTNFNRLEVGWRFKTDNLGPLPEYKLEGTPLMANGTVYTTAGTRRAVVALNATTGELRWVYGMEEGARGAASPRQLSGRGVAYWTDGREERIFYVTPGYRLVALNAKTGQPVAGFATNGVVDLKRLAVFGNRQPIDLVTGEIGIHATPVVAGDIVLVGSAFREGNTPRTHNNTKGMVTAFDAKSGARLWTFNTIPRPGEFGNETWQNDSWAVNGNTGVWNQISVDEDLGLAYLPVESPTGDHYGGHRPGNNLFSDSLVAVDLKTGVRKWHYQLVHHTIWNFDISTAPILADLVVNGRPVKAVSIMSKSAFIYVFDRVTGQPIWPIEERPVPKGDVPGEWYSPTQPFPTKPPAFDRQEMTVDELIDFTPELRAEAQRMAARYKLGHIFTPPVVSKVDGPLATLRLWGGTNWPGGAFDPQTHTLFMTSEGRVNAATGLIPSPGKDASDMNFVSGNAITGYRYVSGPGEDVGADALAARKSSAPPAAAAGGGEGPVLTVQGLPLSKPPYGKLNAVNLDRGEILWQVPHGETPDVVRNHPALRGKSIPRTGQGGTPGVLVTATLAIAGETQFTTTADHPRGAMLRAYDKATGKDAGAVLMPAPQSGSPMTYEAGGRQYIVVAVSGGNYSGEYIAFRLPAR